MIDLKKSYRFSRFHFILLLIIVLLLMGVLLRFFDMIQASLEEVTVESNLLNMRQMLHIQNLLTKSKDPQCKFLDEPDLFQQINPATTNSAESNTTPGTWVYDPKEHKITYNVRSKNYFRSEIAQKVVVSLYCKEGVVVFKEKSFQWCQDKKMWGCSAW